MSKSGDDSGPADTDEIAAIKAALAARADSAADDIALAETAFLLAQRHHPGRSLDRYKNHIDKLCQAVAARYQELCEAGADDDAGTRLAALKHVIVEQNEYQACAAAGPDSHYPEPDNADLIRVIDTRTGVPVALAILYIEAGRAQGWSVEGVDLPGHFILRLDHNGQRVLFDPANGAQPLQAADLRGLVKEALGPEAELTARYYEPVSNRTILIRLQNHIKLRQIELEDYEAAAQTVDLMRVLAPDEDRLLLDAGVLYARIGRPAEAIAVLERYLKKAPNSPLHNEALYLLQQLRQESE